jgi:hypothetical protein
MINENKISTFNLKLQFFSAGFYKGRERLRGINFFRSTGAGRARGGVMEGGGSVCPFVCESRKVIRQHCQTVDETLHLFGQLGFARDGG